jgi:hypothetical protein
MPWTCFIVDDISQATEPGAMWPVHNERDNRTDWYILFPGGGFHNIHDGFADGTGWQVTGEAPRFTVTPSLKCCEVRHGDKLYRKGWHGYLTNGVLTDDYEGRTY